MCHNAVRKARAKELKHMQNHYVFEVVWPSEVGSLTKVRSNWLQDKKGDAVKARCVAQQVAHRKRDDVFAGTPLLAVARTLLAWAASRNMKGTRCIGWFDTIRALTNRRAHCSHSASWYCPASPGTLVETCTVRNAQSFEVLVEKPYSKRP